MDDAKDKGSETKQSLLLTTEAVANVSPFTQVPQAPTPQRWFSKGHVKPAHVEDCIPGEEPHV